MTYSASIAQQHVSFSRQSEAAVMGGKESVTFTHSPLPKIANLEHHRPDMQLEELPAARLPVP